MEELRVEYGHRRISAETGDSYIGISKKTRNPYFTALITEAKRLGVPKDYFTPPRKREIVDDITAKGLKVNQIKTKLWIKISLRDLGHTIIEVYGKETRVNKIESEIVAVENTKKAPKYVDDAGNEIHFKEHDPSKYADIDEPSVSRELDEEMAKILGLKDE